MFASTTARAALRQTQFHIPFARKALEGSAAKKVESHHPLPDYEEGYQEWSRAYAQKRAGIYVVSVAQAVSVAEKTFQKGHRMRSSTVSVSDMGIYHQLSQFSQQTL